MAYNFENLWKNKGGLGFFFFQQNILKTNAKLHYALQNEESKKQQ